MDGAPLSLRAVEAAIEAAFRSQDAIATDEATEPDPDLVEIMIDGEPEQLVFAGPFRFSR